jgi:hypothetical protein
MQDIVPKGKSIRNIPVPETRRPAKKAEPKPAKKSGPTHLIVEEKDDVKNVIKAEIKKPVRKAKPAPVPDSEVKPLIDESEMIQEKLSERSQEEKARWETLEEVRKEFEEGSQVPRERGGKRWLKIVIALFVLLGGVFAVSSFFDSATVLITPRTVLQSVKSDYAAEKASNAAALSYQVITIEETGTQTVKATGERKVERKATGNIVVYNNYSTSPQRLIKNTRFATPEGLIFRITDSITVPGKKGSTPGQVETLVVADEPGEKYNVGLKDFTIPGFKGDPRYTAFYARSKTPLEGGFIGTERVVAPEDRTTAKSAIEQKIAAKLVERIPSALPSDKVTFDKAYAIEYKTLPEESVSSSEVALKELGTMSIVVFDRAQLSENLATAHIKGYAGDPVSIKNLDILSFSPKGQFDPAKNNKIFFTLTGDAVFEWLYDENALKQALVGKPRKEISAILKGYPTIEKADISLRPAWARSFPDEVEKITVEKAQ